MEVMLPHLCQKSQNFPENFPTIFTRKYYSENIYRPCIIITIHGRSETNTGDLSLSFFRSALLFFTFRPEVYDISIVRSQMLRRQRQHKSQAFCLRTPSASGPRPAVHNTHVRQTHRSSRDSGRSRHHAKSPVFLMRLTS